MVGETIIMNAVILAMSSGEAHNVGDASILRLFRLLRLTRMARMMKLLRAMPELMIMIKGMKVAMRSVFFTLCLLMLIIYIFAIAFTQVLEGSPVGERSFKTVVDSVNALLLHGVLPDQSPLIEDIGREHFLYRLAILVYILLASLTVMNMLVGVLCEVVSVVSAVEKETLLVNYVKQQLTPMLKASLDGFMDYNSKIGKDEFTNLLERPEAARALQDVGVDVVSLVDFTDFIFKDGKELSFSDCMDVVLQLRGTNASTVKDVVDLRKQVLGELKLMENENKEWQSKMEAIVTGIFAITKKIPIPQDVRKSMDVRKSLALQMAQQGDRKSVHVPRQTAVKFAATQENTEAANSTDHAASR